MQDGKRQTPYGTSITCRKLTRATKSCCSQSLTIFAINYRVRQKKSFILKKFDNILLTTKIFKLQFYTLKT